MLLVGRQEGHPACKNMGEWWALVSPDGVASSQMVDVSAFVNLPLHHKVQKFSSGTSSPEWSRKKGRKMVVCVSVCLENIEIFYSVRKRERVAAWRSGNIVGPINEVTLRWARLVLGWVTVFGG